MWTREVSWDERSHPTYAKAEVRCICQGCNLPPFIYVFSLKARAAGTHHISASRQCESTKKQGVAKRRKTNKNVKRHGDARTKAKLQLHAGRINRMQRQQGHL